MTDSDRIINELKYQTAILKAILDRLGGPPEQTGVRPKKIKCKKCKEWHIPMVVCPKFLGRYSAERSPKNEFEIGFTKDDFD